ncbi:MAG: hypothetical protein KY396_05220 [Actinobacteria bacterium]|nr:hypothetical protein [Actinomycetota bacterium]
MALLQRDRHTVDDSRTTTRTHADEEIRDGERAGPAPGLVRALITLLGLAVAGLLIWLATTFELGTTAGFWTAMGLIAAAGLVVGLSQLLGGWTKWGWPRMSPSVFLFAFLPTLILAGGILLAMRPTDEAGEVRGWAEGLGIEGLVNDLWEVPGVLAFTVGLVFAFCFDTSGPKTKFIAHDGEYVRDEDVHDYRPAETTAGTTGATTSDRSVSEELRTREDDDRPLHEEDDERTHVVTSGSNDDRVHVEESPQRDPERRDTI